MFRISLKDVGVDRVTKDVTCYSDCISNAEAEVNEVVWEILGHDNFDIRILDDGEYAVTKPNALLGSFTITKL